METLHYLFRVLALSQAVFFTLYFLLFYSNRLGYLLALVGFCFASYLVIPLLPDLWRTHSIGYVFIIAATAIPAVLWILAQTFFRDGSRLPLYAYAIFLLYIALALTPANWLAPLLADDTDLASFFVVLLPQSIKLMLVLHVIYIALQDRSRDLVESRRRLRAPLAISAGFVTALVIVVELWAGDAMPIFIEIAGSLLMFVLAVVTSLYLFRLRSDFNMQSASGRQNKVLERDSAGIESLKGEEEALIDRLDTLMKKERYYAGHGITIGDLAKILGCPEYKLRAVINQRLGYRNFNQYLNEFRIGEAADRLISQRELPVLTIALDVGFKSLSSFNKAFRDTHQITPSEYRLGFTRDSEPVQ